MDNPVANYMLALMIVMGVIFLIVFANNAHRAVQVARIKALEVLDDLYDGTQDHRQRRRSFVNAIPVATRRLSQAVWKNSKSAFDSFISSLEKISQKQQKQSSLDRIGRVFQTGVGSCS